MQSATKSLTPRTGGVAIFFSLALACYLSGNETMNLIMLSAIPLFVVGLMEDVKKGEGTQPLTRLFVAAVCSLIAISIFGISIERLDIPMVDPIFQVSIFAILFTMFASAGLTHAMNLIDGVNGLSAFIMLSAMVSFGIVSARYGHSDLLMLNILVCVSCFAFMLFNFPKGQVFLGDAGAYCFGHVIAWNAILLLHREPEISAWALLLIIFWPVADTLFAISRRLHNGKPTGLPDKMHFHQLLMRSFMIFSGKKLPLAHANPLGSVAIWPFVVLTCTLGIILLTEKQLAFFATVFLASIFVISYLTICQWAKTRNMPRFGLYLFGNSSDPQTDP